MQVNDVVSLNDDITAIVLGIGLVITLIYLIKYKFK